MYLRVQMHWIMIAYTVTFMSWLLSSHLQMWFMGFLFNSSFGGLVLSVWCLTSSIADPKILELKVLVSVFVWPIWFLSLIFEPSFMLVTFWLLPPPPHYLGLVKGLYNTFFVELFWLVYYDWCLVKMRFLFIFVCFIYLWIISAII